MKYSVQVLGASKPLFMGNNQVQADNMRVRWAMRLHNCTVILLDNETGEILADM